MDNNIKIIVEDKTSKERTEKTFSHPSKGACMLSLLLFMAGSRNKAISFVREEDKQAFQAFAWRTQPLQFANKSY